MTSLMTSQRDVKVGLLYSCLNEIVAPNFNISSRSKVIFREYGGHFGKFKLFDAALIWLQIRNLRPQLVETILNPIYSFLTPIYYYCQNFQFLQVCSFDHISTFQAIAHKSNKFLV